MNIQHRNYAGSESKTVFKGSSVSKPSLGSTDAVNGWMVGFKRWFTDPSTIKDY